ncbi:MAG: hypothetical protein A4E49_01724 [Methanosaeta sp. PtaU1.Bin112]|nr:MAG: hypothetical protein A4E49_01724 [Methanosaeta sp. PtaU1.Bin112]
MYVKIKAMCVLTGLLALMLAAPAYALGFYGSGHCEARNAIEAYCINHGGCPRDGYCHFPDGSYCELRSFYNGTCPGREYYEQAMWMSEAYRFLYDDGIYSAPYFPNMYPYNYPYYYQPPYAYGYGV